MAIGDAKSGPRRVGGLFVGLPERRPSIAASVQSNADAKLESARYEYRRGVFRLWVVCCSLWRPPLCRTRRSATNFSDVTRLRSGRRSRRGAMSTDYSTSQNLCWYQQAKFRALYPEYSDLSDPELSKRLYAKAGQPLKETRPWTFVAQCAEVAVGVPLVVLVLGWSMVWAFPGFGRA